MPEPTTIPRSV